MHFALCSQLILKAQGLVYTGSKLNKRALVSLKAQIVHRRFCRFCGQIFRFIHRALDVIDITVGCGPAVYIKYTDGLRSIVPVVCHTTAVQLIQNHYDTDVAIIQLLGSNACLILPYKAVGIKFKATIVLTPIWCAENNRHLTFAC